MSATARTRILAGALVLMLGVLGLTGSAAAHNRFTATPIHQGRTYHAAKALSARLAKTDRHLLRLHGNRLVPVMVKFDVDPAASYTGGVSGYRATSPTITGHALAEPTAGVSSYLTYLKARESSIVRSITARVPNVRTLATYRIVYGGASMLVPAGEIGQLLHVPGVVAVQANRLTHPLSDDTRFIGADAVWPSLGGQTLAGDNVIVGDLDTGIWPENPLFADKGLPSFPGTFGCQFGDGSDPLLGPTFACNDKLIGAYAFTDTYMAVIGALPGEFCDNGTGVCSARDADGHGTHTASTAAGSSSKVTLLGINRPSVSGMAPGARIIAYRVCLAQGCFQSDSVAAIQQAILDGVNVINFSISGGANPYQDAVELAFLDAYAAGIDVNAAAGNAGPGPETADHGGPWVTTVGASYGPKFYLTTLRLHAGAATLNLTGSTITKGLKGNHVELAADVGSYGDPLCQTPMDPGIATGLVVVCERGVNGRNEKSFNVMQGGAAGMILYNPTHMDLFSDNFWIPTVMLEGPEPANTLLAFLAAHPVVRAWWGTGTLQSVHADQMTTFSSRGPVGNFIKPDVTAPGIQILEGNTPEPIDVASGPPGELFQAIAGTSMSTPHATGVSALVAAAHPGWTPGQIKSALMTSSVQDVTKEDGVTPADPFDAGAGSIRADRAVHPTLTFDVAAADYAAAAGDPVGEVDLNLPSIDETTMPGDISTKRFGVNVSGSSQTFSVSTTAPAGASIDVTSPNWTVAAGGTLELDVTISGEDLADGQYFGSILLHPASGATDVYMPVAFVKTQGSVTLSNTCSPTTISVGASSACQVSVENLSPSATSVSLQVNSPDSPDLAIENVSAPGVAAGSGFTFSGSLGGAVAPTIDSIDPGGSPAGYLPLASLGVPPLTGVGDETITDLAVPSFQYGSETYDQVGLVSDGYAVVGGGDSTDVNYLPQNLPDPARPNNVIAPFWTDLNPAFGGNMYAADLTDGVNHWVVLEWAGVREYSVPDTVSFQIWLQEGTTESVTFAYGPDVPSAGDPGSALEIGAENRDGSSAAVLSSVPAPGSDWTVVTSPPAPGGSVDITFDAVGNGAGDHPLVARMTSDLVPGTTVEKVVISVVGGGA
jgi:subtilisin family serine protease